MHLSFSDILNIVVGFQLILLIIILLHRGGKNLANRLLAFFFLAQALIYFSIFRVNNLHFITENYPGFVFLFNPVGFTWGPTMFLFVMAQVNPQFRLRTWHILHYAPAIILFLYLFFTFHIQTFDTKQELIAGGVYMRNQVRIIISILVIVQVLVYNLVAIYQFRKFKSRRKSYSAQEKFIFNITQFLLYGYFIACLIHDVVFSLRFVFKESEELNRLTYISMFVFAIYFMIAIYKLVVSPENILTGKRDKRSRQLTIDHGQINTIIERVEELMISKKPYLEFSYGINQLAEELDIKPRELSQAINEVKGQNFYDFINKYRIEEAKKNLLESIGSKETILEIIYASGFNSKTAFNVAFKKQTGLTPSEFKKQHTKPLPD